MNLKTEYHLHGQQKTWLKAKTTETFAQSNSGESLFYLQELSTGEGRVCFNSQLARQIGINFKDLQENFQKAALEDDKKFTSMKFKTIPSYFKDSKNNNMVFDDAVKQILSNRFWTYSSDLKDGKVIDVSAAPFVNKDSAKALFNLIKNNFSKVVNNFENCFQDSRNSLSSLSIGINDKINQPTLREKIQQFKEKSSSEQPTPNSNHKYKI